MTRPFADAVLPYAQAGWPCILPVPVVEKGPPPHGFTGEAGRDTEPAQLVAWVGTHAECSIAIRLPDGLIGIDVDEYDKIKRLPDGTTKVVAKRGAATLAEREAAWGPLPPTWSSTARGPGQPSRIMFYRAPAGRYATTLGDAIEIIQRHHRYAVVWPSANPDAGGAQYRWYAPDGRPVGAPPKPDELPELPAAWVVGLREGATVAGPVAADTARGRAFLAALLADPRPACAEVTSARADALRKLAESSTGTRHDTATERTHHLVQLGASGHPGAGEALAALSAAWDQLTAGENRSDEFARMLLTSARKAVTAVGDRPVGNDPCLMVGSVRLQAPAPVDNRPPGDGSGRLDEPIEPPRVLHPLEVIGVHAFDPRGFLDQIMAAAVLERTYPMLRYATDARLWLLRGPEVWDTRPDLAEWAVALLADRMPHGDADAEKGSDARDQAERRKRFMSASSASAVAKKMRALVAGGAHPCALELAQLDREPWLLWAGGIGWDLRASAARPTPAQIDPATPHRHSAGIAPDVRPTPLWDAFTAAVWPDPELRAWALRVLSIAVTGYSDKVLPILVGEKDRGKTQIVALIMSVLGTYAHAADPRLLGAEISTTHSSIIYALMGRRLSFIDEGPREGKIGQERLKQLTGGGELTANAMHSNPVTWRPTHTLVLTSNDDPTLTDPAVRSRVRLIPCTGDPAAVIATRAAIGHPGERAWRAEAPGVLALLMREAALWLADPSSALTTAAPEQYRYRAEQIAAEQDPVNAWIDEETIPDPVGERANTLYEAFRAWCQRNGVPGAQIPSRMKWGLEMGRRGYPATHDRDGKRRPLRLRMPGNAGPMFAPAPAEGSQVVTPPAPPAETPRDHYTPSGDHLVTTKEASGHTLNPLQGKDSSVSVTTVTTKTDKSQHARARTHAHMRAHMGGELETGSQRSQGSQGVSAADRRVSIKLEARRQAILDAGGPVIPLPAAVDRVGHITPLTVAEAGQRLAEIIARAGALTVDVEHTGYPVGHRHHRLRTVQLGDEESAIVLDAGDPAHVEVARMALAAAPVLHAHSATADLVPLAAVGIVPMAAWDRMYDTVIPAKLADPTSTGSDPGLKQLAGSVLGAEATAPPAETARAALFRAGRWLTETEPSTPVERSGWAQVDPRCSTMIRYAASDVLDAAALARRLPELPPAILARERAVQRITARVAHIGLRIDGEHVTRLRTEHDAAMREAAERVAGLGVASPGSNQQLYTALMAAGATLPRTPTGRPSVAAAALDALRGTSGKAGELVAAVLDYRHHETVTSTFLEPYRQLVEHGDGRARPTVYTLGTDTGRMSCVRPNLQQLPREGGVRACITADPGHMLISADFSGVELRVAAALSGDTNLAHIIASGDDLHWRIAREVFGPDATKADRYMVKRGVFGRLYGGGLATLARQVGVSESVMASAIEVLDSITPGLAAWSREVRNAVKRGATQFPSYSGRVIWLPQDYPHKAPNYCIQGSARELLVDALIRWSDTPWGGSVVLPVHDEIVAVVPAEDAERATAALTQCMDSQLFGVPIATEASKPAFAWQDSV